MNTAERIARILLNTKAVTLSANPPYIWTSGIKAPMYCDNRLLISYPKERKEIIAEFKTLIRGHQIECDVIGGTATAAIPWAAFLAYELDKPLVYIRPEPKGHGAEKQVEGRMEKGSRVLILEDLISTGDSSVRSAEACQREYGATIVGVMAIFTYEMQKSKKAFLHAGIPWHTLSNFSTLIDVATNEHYIKPEEKDFILGWSKNPEHWNIS